MIVVNFDEYNINRKLILSDMQKSVFIYPSDTIYSIGCNALDARLVEKIRKLKNTSKPFSVLVPNKEWIYENCVVTAEAEEWIRKLPGTYTLMLKLKNPKAVSRNVYNNEDMIIGVRMPNHWFLGVAYSTKIPLVITSANITGEDFMTSLEDIDSRIRNSVDYIFYEGKKHGTPSSVISLAGTRVKIHQNEIKKSAKKISFPIAEIDSIKKQ